MYNLSGTLTEIWIYIYNFEMYHYRFSFQKF